MPPTRRPTPVTAPDAPPQQVVFLLLERFTMIAFAGAVEALRLANRATGRTLYEWRLAGEAGPEGGGIACSNGAVFRPDMGLEPVGPGRRILVCGGLEVQRACTRPVLAWLRREAAHGGPMGGLCTGAHALARAGLLEGHSATIHWENHDAFAEQFPGVSLTRSVFVIDRNRWTAAGGTATIDLMLRAITDDHGPDLAADVADQLIHSAVHPEAGGQRLAVLPRIGVRHPRLGQVIQRMEATLDDPLSPVELAEAVGMSSRQLERLFRQYLSRSPKRHYMDLRLQKARNLLLQTDLSVIAVALACGFANASHFARCYRAQFGITPLRERFLHQSASAASGTMGPPPKAVGD